ncbi:MAG: response regulator [Verrucomicrobiales bacterium]|nr:response regulator [Verrucomicrobiales bacterium]
MSQPILVVDDSLVNRTVAETKLTDAGFEVVLANDGAEALEILHLDSDDQHPPVMAVLLDIMMPDIDGMEVLDHIRKRWSSIQLPVIMATAKDEREDVLAALEAGANDFVSKPLDLQILLARLNSHLALKKTHEELKRAQQSLVNAARIESVGLLAAGVAHEIRNPLGRIEMAAAGFETLLGSLAESDQETGKIITDTIRDSVKAADLIVKELMRASADQQLELIPTDLNAEIKTLAKEFRTQLSEAEVKVSFQLDKSIPLVPLASEEFRRGLGEIVENAIQAMKVEGGDDRTLTFQSELSNLSGIGSNEGARSGNRMRDGDEVVALHIIDSGPGLSKGDVDRVFDAFFTTRATGVGTGLGLTVTRKIVDLHKGIIRVSGREDGENGLRVSLYFKTGKGIRTHV